MAKTLKLLLGARSIHLLVLLVAIHAIASWNSWYYSYAWFDIPMHVAGGFILAYLFHDIFVTRGHLHIFGKSSLATLILCLGFVALGGVLWEFYEFGMDLISGRTFMSRGLFDTFKDLVNDLLGGLIFALWVYSGKSYRTTSPSSSAQSTLSS